MLIFKHTPVMLHETIEYLNLKAEGIYLDGTFGRGGHSEMILDKIKSSGKLYAFDRDSEAIQSGQERFSSFKNIEFIQDNYANMDQHLPRKSLDGIILDLGISSPQIDNPSRGFSWVHDGPLDMRMNTQDKLTAAEVINTYPTDELIEIFFDYGEENYARKIAYAIENDRQSTPFSTTKQFADFLFRVAPGTREKKKGAVMRIFQAIRIEVNQELKSLAQGLEKALPLLKKGGRIVVITFHSLEDRIVKQFFQREAKACICPPSIPICQCKHTIQVKILTKKPLLPTPIEVTANPRSRGAKLRAAEKLS